MRWAINPTAWVRSNARTGDLILTGDETAVGNWSRPAPAAGSVTPRSSAERFHQADPEFATFATCMLAVLGTVSASLGHRFGHSLIQGGRGSALFADMLTFQADVVGDRERKVHCAELTTRIYMEAGVPVVDLGDIVEPQWDKAMDKVELGRQGRMGFRPADRADFILPGDYERAQPFTDVGELQRGRFRWFVVRSRPTS